MNQVFLLKKWFKSSLRLCIVSHPRHALYLFVDTIFLCHYAASLSVVMHHLYHFAPSLSTIMYRLTLSFYTVFDLCRDINILWLPLPNMLFFHLQYTFDSTLFLSILHFFEWKQYNLKFICKSGSNSLFNLYMVIGG